MDLKSKLNFNYHMEIWEEGDKEDKPKNVWRSVTFLKY